MTTLHDGALWRHDRTRHCWVRDDGKIVPDRWSRFLDSWVVPLAITAAFVVLVGGVSALAVLGF